MLRILKDCILCGVPVHVGETFPIGDFETKDLNVIIGTGFAERFTPEIKEKASAKPVEAKEDSKPTSKPESVKVPVKKATKKAKK